MAKAEQRQSSEDVELLRFNICSHEYALSVNDVNNIIGSKETTPVPRSSDAIDGVMDYRGETAVVINLKHIMGLNEEISQVDDSKERIIILDEDVDNQTVGIRVDQVIGVSNYSKDSIEEKLNNIEVATSIQGSDLLDGVIVLENGEETEIIELINIEVVLKDATESSRLDLNN